MSEREVHRALSSEARKETLKLLYKRPHAVEEIAEKLNLQPITIRHHIQMLDEAGLLDSFEERTGSAGRPKIFYKIAKSLPTTAFPSRRYLYFSKALVNYFLHEFGTKKTYEMIAQVGGEMGRETATYLETTNDIQEWTPETFASVYVSRYLEEMGTEPEIVEKTDKKVVFKTHNCIFFELSQEMPDLMCDVLHCEFHRALSQAMNKNIETVQTSCMGHGDGHCEQVFEWVNENKKSTDLKRTK